MQSWWLIFILFFLIIFLSPIKIRVKLAYDPYKNKGIFGFAFLFFKFRLSSFKFNGLALQIKQRKSKKEQEVDLNIDKAQLVYFKRLMAQLRDKLRVVRLDAEYKIGSTDAFKSAMMSGLINTVIYSFFAFVKNFKQSGKINLKAKTVYDKQVFKIKFNFTFSISLFNILYCFLFAFINTRRTLLNEQKISRKKYNRRAFNFKH